MVRTNSAAGFVTRGLSHGWYEGVHWIYVNLNSKLYAPGMPGIPITTALGHHAVTIEEFKTIYNIYKKYEGKSIFTFHQEPFDLK